MEPLTVLLASFMVDDDLVSFTATCVENRVILARQRDEAVNRACRILLALLNELDDERQRADDLDTAYWWAHVAQDWEDSD